MAGAIELHNNNRYRPLQKAAIGRLPSYLMNREELMTRMFGKKLIAGATAGAIHGDRDRPAGGERHFPQCGDSHHPEMGHAALIRRRDGR